MRTIKLTISYDGTSYCGWQVQPSGTSVQGLLQAALARMTGEGVSVIGAGRTDAGVHALGQVAHFLTESKIPPAGFARGLGSLLPDDIAVLRAEEADEGFHARSSARGKLYAYRIISECRGAPLALNRCWRMPGALDLAGMREGACRLIGEHDFESFRASGCTARDAVRRIERIEVGGVAAPEIACAGMGRLIELQFEGDGFVRHMIRNIVGTLVDIGSGRVAPRDIDAIIAARDREQAGRCAPACGLYLVRVVY